MEQVSTLPSHANSSRLPASNLPVETLDTDRHDSPPRGCVAIVGSPLYEPSVGAHSENGSVVIEPDALARAALTLTSVSGSITTDYLSQETES